jgi:formamidase
MNGRAARAAVLTSPFIRGKYLLLGSAPIEGRISGVVDIPNACCSLYLPTAIFDIDIRPTAGGPTPADRGTSALTS